MQLKIKNHLNAIIGLRYDLVSSLPDSKGFAGKISTDLEARAALSHFINTALLIRDQREFENSILHKLDLLLDNVDTYDEHFANTENFDSVTMEGTFIALAAPSMEGKTQSAFVFRRVKPLYFPLSGVRSAGVAAQPIYKNFAHLSDSIIEYATLDFINVRYLKCNIDIPTLNDFDEDLKSYKYWTLGFLCHLVEDGRNISGEDWMRYHVERPSFHFQARSINSLENGFFNGFCIFLDEFKLEEVGVFIQNLARVSNLTCLVANSNSRISSPTRGLPNDRNVWSLVVPQLNSSDTYSDIYNLNNDLELIRTIGQSDPRIQRFISDFDANQAKHLRPGVAKLIKEGFSKLNSLLPVQDLNIRIFLDNIVEAISKSLCSRRPELSSDPLSQWAKIGLLFPPSFEYDYIYDIYSERDDFTFHLPCFLEYHFYHLINPIDTNYWLFMTFAPRIGNRNLTLQDGFEWLNQYTYFKIEDLFTILGCLWISFSGPVTELLKSAKKGSLLGFLIFFF